jgi:hypothetical protein
MRAAPAPGLDTRTGSTMNQAGTLKYSVNVDAYMALLSRLTISLNGRMT